MHHYCQLYLQGSTSAPALRRLVHTPTIDAVIGGSRTGSALSLSLSLPHSQHPLWQSWGVNMIVPPLILAQPSVGSGPQPIRRESRLRQSSRNQMMTMSHFKKIPAILTKRRITKRRVWTVCMTKEEENYDLFWLMTNTRTSIIH